MVEECDANGERVASLHLRVGDLFSGTSLVREVSTPSCHVLRVAGGIESEGTAFFWSMNSRKKALLDLPTALTELDW